MASWRSSMAPVAALVIAATSLVAVPRATAIEPPQARSSTPAIIAAVGDSYLAGIGAGDYFVADGCRRSQQSAPARLARSTSARLVDTTCPGATIESSSRRAAIIPRDADLVLVQAGGNDMGFATLAGACILAGTSTCLATVRDGHRRLPGIRAGLLALVRQIRLTAPGADVVVLGYPRLLGSPERCQTLLPRDRVRAVDRLQRSLDRVIRSSARTGGAEFVDWPRSVDRASLCSADPWYALPGDRIDDLLHPDERATVALARRLAARWDR